MSLSLRQAKAQEKKRETKEKPKPPKKKEQEQVEENLYTEENSGITIGDLIDKDIFNNIEE